MGETDIAVSAHFELCFAGLTLIFFVASRSSPTFDHRPNEGWNDYESSSQEWSEDGSSDYNSTGYDSGFG